MKSESYREFCQPMFSDDDEPESKSDSISVRNVTGVSYLNPKDVLHCEELGLGFNIQRNQPLDRRIERCWFLCFRKHAPGDPPYAHLLTMSKGTF